MTPAERNDWQERGEGPMTDAQRRLLNAICDDLAKGIKFWHGERFSKDDFRHLICGCVLGDRIVRGINTGERRAGLIRMARSSKELTKSEATEAIHMGLDVGERPEDQDLDCRPVRWCAVVSLACFITEDAP